MAIQAFTVLSEFKFDVAHAVVGSEKLQNSVNGISEAVSNAQKSIAGLGMGIMASFTGAQAGLFGILSNAISSADKFKSSQIEMANAMVANGMTMNGDIVTFNQALSKSSTIMDEIISKSRKMGLNPDEFVNQTKFYNNMLAPKGLAGTNLSNASELARVSMKAAPALGVSGDQATSGIMDGISGQLSKQTQFGTRLFMEAGDAISASTQGAIKDLKSFNSAKPEMRIKALIAGLDKLAGSADTVAARADTFSNKLNTLKNLFIGVGSVFKPFGDVLIKFINQILDIAIKFISGKGSTLINMMTKFMSKFLKTPEQLMIAMKQASELGSDFKAATVTGGLVSIFELISHIPFIFPIMSGLASILMKTLGVAFTALGKILILLWPVINVFAGAMITFAAATTVLTAAFQGISQAIARMEIETIVWLADKSVELAEVMGMLKDSFNRIMQPIYDITTGFAELTYAIFGGTYVLDFLLEIIKNLTSAAELLSGGFSVIYNGFRAMIAGMFDVIFRAAENISIIFDNLKSGNILNPMDGTKNILAGYMQAFNEEFDSGMEKALSPNIVNGVDNNKIQNNVHNYDVKMTNNFKEVLQPDRIAFTIQSQLEKASRNRTGANASGLAAQQAGR